MTSSPEITVIIPVYNASKTIDMALSSLINEQMVDLNISEWEIITINDGSNDDSLLKLQKWQSKYPENIILIDQPNSGVSKARNKAIDTAKGRWIILIDADDYLVPHTIHFLLDKVKSMRVDWIQYNINIIPESEVTSAHIETFDTMMSLTTTTGLRYLDDTKGGLISMGIGVGYLGIVNKDLIGSTRFNESLNIGEDCIFTLSLMLKNPIMAIIKQPLYIYIQYPNSTVNNRNPEHLTKLASGRLKFRNGLLELEHTHRSSINNNISLGLKTIARNTHNEALIDNICLGSSLKKLWKILRDSKNKGLKIKPGTPRFYNRTIKYSLRQKIRRLIVALVMPTAMGLIDFVRGRGLWTLKNPQYID